MKLSDKEASVKMALIADKSWKKEIDSDRIFINQDEPNHSFTTLWNPKEDIKQSFEVLEALFKKGFAIDVGSNVDNWLCLLYPLGGQVDWELSIEVESETPQGAIFGAVKQYLEDKKND